MITKPKPILGVAILYKGIVYKLPAPNRHHHVIRMIGGIDGPDKQGFYSEDVDFMSRTFAMQVAIQTGQLKDRKPGQYSGDELFSEDMW